VRGIPRRIGAIALLLWGGAHFSALAPRPALAGSPQIDFMLECQGCHLADGAGSPKSVPALGGSMAKFLTVPGGREYLVRVPGSAQSPLDDDALAAVLNWMLWKFGPSEFAAAAEAYTGSEVARLRTRPLIDVEATRRSLIEQIELRP
jgi:hypothetical protein